MSIATGFIITFTLIALGGVGLAVFAIAHRERDNDVKERSGDQFRPA